MGAKSIISLVLAVTLITLTAAPPAGAEVVTAVTVALVVAFVGTVAVTETVRHEQLKNGNATAQEQAAVTDQVFTDPPQSAAATP